MSDHLGVPYKVTVDNRFRLPFSIPLDSRILFGSNATTVDYVLSMYESKVNENRRTIVGPTIINFFLLKIKLGVLKFQVPWSSVPGNSKHSYGSVPGNPERILTCFEIKEKIR